MSSKGSQGLRRVREGGDGIQADGVQADWGMAAAGSSDERCRGSLLRRRVIYVDLISIERSIGDNGNSLT